MSANTIATREDAKKSWEECKVIHGNIRRFAMAGNFGPAVLIADLAHNLTLIQAYAALGVALLYKLGKPVTNKTSLKSLITQCEEANLVTWKDLTLMDEGREKRNDVAHHAKWINRAEVFKYAEAIQEELIAMGILTPSDSIEFYDR